MTATKLPTNCARRSLPSESSPTTIRSGSSWWEVETPDGNRFEHLVVRAQTVVLTVVINDEDQVLMLRRHRFATSECEWGWELPGGILGQAGCAPTVSRISMPSSMSADRAQCAQQKKWPPTSTPCPTILVSQCSQIGASR